jgi:hypothetical protein
MSMTEQLQQLEVAFAAASAGETTIGRVERVSGVRVEVRFKFEPTQDDHGSFHLGVGPLLGIRSQNSIVVGMRSELKIAMRLFRTRPRMSRAGPSILSAKSSRRTARRAFIAAFSINRASMPPCSI